MDNSQRVLFVDFEGGMVPADYWAQLILQQIRKDTRWLWPFFCWSLQGKSVLRQRLWSRIRSGPSDIACHEVVLEFLRVQRSSGTPLVLASHADHEQARAVANHLGIFDNVIDVVDSESGGQPFLETVTRYCRQHNYAGYDYLGNGHACASVCERADQVYAVSPGRVELRETQNAAQSVGVLRNGPQKVAAVIKALRPCQWIKNVLIFVPLLLGHAIADFDRFRALLVAFAAFCCCASFAYVTNDMFDVAVDRSHPHKRHRPFASGKLSIRAGILLALTLAILATLLSLATGSWGFTICLAVYLLATTAYSIWLRRLFLVDVAVLSAFYTLRIIAGGYASDMAVSGWLIAFSVFLFGSLAFAKRSAELQGLSASDADVSRGRAYRADHLSLLKKLGRSAAAASVIVFWLYLVGDAASELYPTGWLLWLILPILCLWLFRLWWLVESGSLSDDPLMYAIKDRGSLTLIIASAILVITAALPFS